MHTTFHITGTKLTNSTKNTGPASEPDALRKKYREYLDNQTQLKQSTRDDQETILANFPPIEKLNAKYFRTMMKKGVLSPHTIWKRYGLAKRVLNELEIEHDLHTLKGKLPKLSRIETVTVEDLYTKDELSAIFKACNSIRDRAMLEVLYESAVRASELLSMTKENIQFNDNNTAIIIVKGKTGTRKIPLYRSVPALKQWLNVHPVGKGRIWVSTTREKHNPLSRQHLHSIVKAAVKGANLTRTKRKLVHMFRHTRITELVVLGIRGQTLHKLVGWTRRSNMEAVYVHLTTDDVENHVFEKVFGFEIDETKKKPLLDLKMCPSCHLQNDEHATVCAKCGFPLTDEGLRELKSRVDEINSLRSEVDYLRKTTESLTRTVHTTMSIIEAMSEELGPEFAELFKQRFRVAEGNKE